MPHLGGAPSVRSGTAHDSETRRLSDERGHDCEITARSLVDVVAVAPTYTALALLGQAGTSAARTLEEVVRQVAAAVSSLDLYPTESSFPGRNGRSDSRSRHHGSAAVRGAAYARKLGRVLTRVAAICAAGFSVAIAIPPPPRAHCYAASRPRGHAGLAAAAGRGIMLADVAVRSRGDTEENAPWTSKPPHPPSSCHWMAQSSASASWTRCAPSRRGSARRSSFSAWG